MDYKGPPCAEALRQHLKVWALILTLSLGLGLSVNGVRILAIIE